MYIIIIQRNLSEKCEDPCPWRRVKETDWNDGARAAMEIMGKPDARTANDWNKPITTWSPGDSSFRAGSPILRTLNEVHSIPLDHRQQISQLRNGALSTHVNKTRVASKNQVTWDGNK